jgi:hypothetical protein
MFSVFYVVLWFFFLFCLLRTVSSMPNVDSVSGSHSLLCPMLTVSLARTVFIAQCWQCLWLAQSSVPNVDSVSGSHSLLCPMLTVSLARTVFIAHSIFSIWHDMCVILSQTNFTEFKSMKGIVRIFKLGSCSKYCGTGSQYNSRTCTYLVINVIFFLNHVNTFILNDVTFNILYYNIK